MRKGLFSLGIIFILVAGVVFLGAIRLQAKEKPESATKAREERLQVKQEKQATRAAIMESRKVEIEEKKEQLKEEIKERREEMKAEIADEREEFKEKMQLIKDERKQQIVEKIDTKLTSLNQRRTDHYSQVIGKMWVIFGKIQDKVAAAGENVADTAATAALDAAKSAIEEAEGAVSNQAGKDYTAEIEDEDSLKATVGVSFQALKDDLKITHSLLVEARQLLAQAARVAAHLSSAANSNNGAGDGTELSPVPTQGEVVTVTPTDVELSPTPTAAELSPTPTEVVELSPTPTETI